MVVAASRNHLYRRRSQVMIDAGPRNHLYLLGQQVKIRSSPRNHLYLRSTPSSGGVFRLCGNRKDSSKIALNVDLHLALNRRQHDLIYQLRAAVQKSATVAAE